MAAVHAIELQAIAGQIGLSRVVAV